jgi:hypothetical protein
LAIETCAMVPITGGWKRLADSCRPFGTEVEVKGDMAEIRLKDEK